MTSPINAITGPTGLDNIDAIGSSGGTDALSGLTATPATPTAPDVPAVSGPNEDFAGMLSQGLQAVQAQQTKADVLGVQVADGSLTDPAKYTMAATEASLGLQLTLAVRNKALDAFQEIMRMQA